jgi:arginine deiminase
VLVSRPTENETRPEYAQEWQYYYSSAAGNADLGRLQAQFNEYYHLVNYGFVRELVRRDYTIIEVPVEEYWDLAPNGVTLSPGKVVLNASSPTVVRELERNGVEVIQVDFSESHRFAIAGLQCATMELVRD